MAFKKLQIQSFDDDKLAKNLKSKKSQQRQLMEKLAVVSQELSILLEEQVERLSEKK